MPPVLSPAEQLGLSGAALDGRVRRAAYHVSDATFARIDERLKADAFANEMVYERDGVREPIRIMLAPLLAMRAQLAYVHHVCLQLSEALKRLPGLYFDDKRIREIVAITPDEERWIRDTWTPAHQRLNRVYGRLDAVCDFTGAGWQDSLHFMEANLSGVGGIHLGPIAEHLVMRDVVPTIAAHDPALVMELPSDQRELFVQVLIDHARALGRDGCQLCFIDPKYIHEGPDEQTALSQYLSRHHNLVIGHADPRELRIDDDEVFYEDIRIDVAYRDYELRELVALERELGKPLDGMRQLFKRNQVVSSVTGDFDHKSCFEILTDPKIAEKLFSAGDCRLFQRHVLWTRVAGDRKTTLPHHGEGDLLEFARLHREQLVLKPNRAYGGTGVVLGAAASQGEWESLLDNAAASYTDPEQSWVLQSATRLPVYEFPGVGADGRVFGEPFYCVMGFTATENGLALMCRASQKQVVNVAQRGGLAAVLIADMPADIQIPKHSQQGHSQADESLRAQIVELRHLDYAIGLLGWDEETMLPPQGREERGDQLATLEGLRHRLLTSDQLGDMIEEVAIQCETDTRWQRELALLRRLRRDALALPEDLVRHYATAKSHSLGAWEEARKNNDFSIFAGPFDHLLTLVRERAAALCGDGEPYDALLGEYERGMSRSRLDPVLTEVRDKLVPLVRAAGSTKADENLSNRKFDSFKQWGLNRTLLATMGFDFERGRLDRSTHPFTLAAGADDVRLTLRMNEDDPTSGILAALHEGGHGLYDQGFDPNDRGTLLADAPSMGLHESQSRLWENHIGRSRAFWAYLSPRMREAFGDAMAGLDAADFWRHVTVLQPGVNRIDADEISYHLHILLRYELEVALLTGDLKTRDLPTAWNELSRKLIGPAPGSDRDGVLQDVHWSLGMFGYFVTYTLGSLYSAQFAETYGRDHALDDEIARGDFAGLLAWLRTNVHRHGHHFEAEDIVTRATGKGLDPGAFFRYVANRIG